jgi:integrase
MRKKTGTIVKTKLGLWQAVVTLPDGSRKRLPPFPKGTSEAMAREKAAVYAERAAAVRLPSPELAAALDELATRPNGPWFKSWLAEREARGFTSTRENESHYRLHIGPSTAWEPVKDWTRDTLRKLSRDLDAKVRAGSMAWKMAQNVWGTATKMCDDAAESKVDVIRCRTDNPADGVRGPDRGDELGLQFLYPSEFLQFVSCSEVPLRWRRIAAISVYLYPREAELRALDCSDVDVEHLTAKISKALDRERTGIKGTKGKRSRAVAIEAPLVALLAAILAEREGKGRLLPELPSARDMARGLRRWLWKAGVRRHELHNDTPTTRKIRFHDLRATGLTWLAVRGDDPLKIQQRAGHREFGTTQKYIRLAEAIAGGFGDAFPPLPPELYELRDNGEDFIRSPESSHPLVSDERNSGILRGGRDSNPRPPA